MMSRLVSFGCDQRFHRSWHRVAERVSTRQLRRVEPISYRAPLAFFLISLAIIATAWWWLATPVVLVRAPIDPAQKLECVSYTPFRGSQTPLNPTLRVGADQIREDLKQLSQITNCVRTYSVDVGLEQIPSIAAETGIKVILGIWIGNDRLKNRLQIATAVALSKEFPGTISSIVVGNEVLLRGEMLGADLAGIIRSVKAQVPSVPVTYADVWEFWLRNREVYDAVDFVTIHILPYWEDVPIRARYAANHVDSIRKRMAVAFPNKEILIGETGWPSEGRMREGALPSRANQARVVAEILDLSKREGFRVNLIEAYDQPWKRQLEGTVGGYWGLIGEDPRTLKYPAGEPVSNFPKWKTYLGAGVAFGTLIFAVALLTLRRKPWKPRWTAWIAVFVSATAGGILLGVGIDKLMYESLGWAGWAQNGVLMALGLIIPLVATYALMAGQPMPAFVELIGPREDRRTGTVNRVLGFALAVLAVLAAETALGFVFDPRYRDFQFASLTMAVLPLAGLMTFNRPKQGSRPIAEAAFAGVLFASSAFVVVNEGFNNWQSVWTCAVYVLFGFTLWQARVVRS